MFSVDKYLYYILANIDNLECLVVVGLIHTDIGRSGHRSLGGWLDRLVRVDGYVGLLTPLKKFQNKIPLGEIS